MFQNNLAKMAVLHTVTLNRCKYSCDYSKFSVTFDNMVVSSVFKNVAITAKKRMIYQIKIVILQI